VSGCETFRPTGVTIGDVLEIFAGGCLVAASFLYLGAPLAFLAGGLCLGYLAQCYTENFPKPRLPAFLRRHKDQA
jgi:hypothetical protein